MTYFLNRKMDARLSGFCPVCSSSFGETSYGAFPEPGAVLESGAILGCQCHRSGKETILVIERLLELGKRVLAESDLDRVLTAALDGVIELCGAERGMILLFDPEGPEGEVVVETARNLAP